MLRKLNIGEKLALLMISFTLVVTIFLSSSYYIQFDEALRERVFLQLSSVKQLKKVKILNELQDHVISFRKLANDSIQYPTGDFLFTLRSNDLPDSLLNYQIPFVEPSDSLHIVDLTNQHPEDGITVAIIDHKPQQVTTSLVRLPQVQAILLERTGLGETGESYIVNASHQLITKSRFDNVNWQNYEVRTSGVLQAFEGKPGTDIFLDYRGIRVLGAFELITFGDIQWVILSEINYEEAMAPLAEVRSNLLITFCIIFVFILIVSYYLSRQIVKPIITMEQQLIHLSEGNLDRNIPAIKNRNQDEIGHMFNALNSLIEALNNTVVFAGEIGAGNFDADYKPLGKKDRLGKALIQMKKQLQEFQLNEEKLKRENQLSIVDGQEKERARLSKELHDGLGPLLTILRINIEDTALQQEEKDKLLRQIDDAINEVRRMSNNLMPSVLEDFGVGEAIKNLVKQINDSSSDVKIRYINDMQRESKLDKLHHITIYRVVQEAINNALKHSDCSEIRVSLSEFDEYLGLFISDNGRGFKTNDHYAGNGLRNIKERIKMVPGSIDIRSDNNGTTIEIEIPYQ